MIEREVNLYNKDMSWTEEYIEADSVAHNTLAGLVDQLTNQGLQIDQISYIITSATNLLLLQNQLHQRLGIIGLRGKHDKT